MNFCSNCGSSDIIYEIPENDSFGRKICQNCHTIHYENPKIIVATIPVKENKILLCKRAIEPMKGKWTLPGGYMENGESAEEGAARETWEEATAKVDILRLHTLYSLPHVNQVYLFFLANVVSDFAAGEESLEVGLFAENEIPWEELVFSSAHFALKKYFENPTETKTHLGIYSPNKAK